MSEIEFSSNEDSFFKHVLGWFINIHLQNRRKGRAIGTRSLKIEEISYTYLL